MGADLYFYFDNKFLFAPVALQLDRCPVVALIIGELCKLSVADSAYTSFEIKSIGALLWI